MNSYRNVGWNVVYCVYPAGRNWGEISSAQGSVVGPPNSSWLK